MLSYQDENFYYKDKMVPLLSYLCNLNPWTWKDGLYIETAPAGTSFFAEQLEESQGSADDADKHSHHGGTLPARWDKLNPGMGATTKSRNRGTVESKDGKDN